MNLIKRAGIWVKVAWDYVCSYGPVESKILDPEQTIAYLLKTGKSMIRMGDGEFNLMNGKNVHYQKHSPALQKEMESLLKNYSADSPYLLCVPYRYFTGSNRMLNSRTLISCWSTPKRMFQKLENPGLIYGDAFLFAKNNRALDCGRLWRDADNVIVLHNDPRYLQQAFDPKTQNGFFVQVPARDTFEVLDEIEEKITGVFEKNNLEKEKTVVLLSAGPAAKVLVKRLSAKGYRMIDCGHIWDDPLEV